MNRMAAPDCAVMCNLINTQTHTQSVRKARCLYTTIVANRVRRTGRRANGVEGEIGVAGGNGDGNGDGNGGGGRNGDVNGDGDGDGAGTGTGT